MRPLDPRAGVRGPRAAASRRGGPSLRAGRLHLGLLGALAVAWGAVGCGASGPADRRPPTEALREAARAATDAAGRREVLARVVESRRSRIHDRALRALEAELRAGLGDWVGALDLTDADEAAPPDAAGHARLRRWVEAADAWARWLPIAEAAGHDDPRAAPADHAIWLRARAAAAPGEALEQALAALDRRPGDPHLLTAAAAAAARAERWGAALLSASRALDEARQAGVEPPSPARSMLALACAERDPARALAAFEEARVEALPGARRAEARFLLRHARPRAAARVLAEWLDVHPLDRESAALLAQIDAIVGRVEGEVAPQ